MMLPVLITCPLFVILSFFYLAQSSIEFGDKESQPLSSGA